MGWDGVVGNGGAGMIGMGWGGEFLQKGAGLGEEYNMDGRDRHRKIDWIPALLRDRWACYEKAPPAVQEEKGDGSTMV